MISREEKQKGNKIVTSVPRCIQRSPVFSWRPLNKGMKGNGHLPSVSNWALSGYFILKAIWSSCFRGMLSFWVIYAHWTCSPIHKRNLTADNNPQWSYLLFLSNYFNHFLCSLLQIPCCYQSPRESQTSRQELQANLTRHWHPSQLNTQLVRWRIFYSLPLALKKNFWFDVRFLNWLDQAGLSL